MSSEDTVWTPLPRNYEQEHVNARVSFVNTTQHPLFNSASTVETTFQQKTSNTKATPEDPLQSKSNFDDSKASFDDPLRAMSNTFDDPLSSAMDVYVPEVVVHAVSKSADKVTKDNEIVKQLIENDHGLENNFEFWSDMCPHILSKYTTSANIALDNTFLNDGENEQEEQQPDKPKDKKKIVDQAASRVEEFEHEGGGSSASRSYLSQRDFINHIEEQHKKLKAAWDAGERVTALRIAIQCAKLLGDMSVPAFYPSMFVVLTRILDTFGDLVFHRIKSRGIEHYDPVTRQMVYTSLPGNFKASDVSASAKETCLNWFYKTICIRELLPRFYIDLALIKCYRFVEDDSFSDNLLRLSRTIRGIGDPLAAAYARVYLTRKALDLTYTYMDNPPLPMLRTYIGPTYKEAVVETWKDQMFVLKSGLEDNFTMVALIKNNSLTIEQYLDLYTPALRWLTQNIAYKAGLPVYEEFMMQYEESQVAPLLLQILSKVDSKYIAHYAENLVGLIKSVKTTPQISQAVLYLELSKALVKSPAPEEVRLKLLNDIWKVVTKLQDMTEYMAVAEVFIGFIVQYFTVREVNIFLLDVVKHVKQDEAYIKQFQRSIELIIVSLVKYTKTLEKILVMDAFLPLLDLLDKTNKVNIAKVTFETWNASKIQTNDTIIINTLFDIGKALHDYITALSYEDDVKQVTHLLLGFVHSIDFGKDLEQQLNIYVDFRAAFTNLDVVIAELVQCTVHLCAKAYNLVSGKHSRKTAAFVKAALAYCHITIPSLEDPFVRAQLYLDVTRVGLLNQMIVPAEGFIKAFVTLVPTLPATITIFSTTKQAQPMIQDLILHMCNILLYFPGHPQNGPFYLALALLNTIPQIEGYHNHQFQTYLGFVRLFVSYAQTVYPYHIYRVESNDTLYASSPEYTSELNGIISKLIDLILKDLEGMNDTDIIARKVKGNYVIEFINTLISSFTMDRHTATLIYKLFEVARKCEDGMDKKVFDYTYDHISRGNSKMYRELCKKLRQNLGFQHKEQQMAPEA